MTISTNETNQAHWRDCNLPRDHRNICRHVDPIESDLVETNVDNTTWLLPGSSILGAVTADREGNGWELTVGRSTRWLSDAEFADLGAFITRCREA